MAAATKQEEEINMTKTVGEEQKKNKEKGELENSILRLQEKMCRSIASLSSPPQNVGNKLSKDTPLTLNPLITEFESQFNNDSDVDYKYLDDDFQNGEGEIAPPPATTTPLMVACDKSNYSALLHLKNYTKTLMSPSSPTSSLRLKQSILYYWIQLIGHPYYSKNEKDGGNCAIHYAASSNFGRGVDILVDITLILNSRNDNTDDETKMNSECEYQEMYLKFLSVENSNSDTPIMMAVAAGCLETIQHWISVLLQYPISSPTQSWGARIHEVFQHKNKTSDDAFLLACGHGHYDILKCLITPQHKPNEDGEEFTITPISHQHLQQCQSVMKNIDMALVSLMQRNGDEHQKDLFHKKRDNVNRCLMSLQNTLNEQITQNMQELLTEEDNSGHADSVKDCSNNNNKKKKKKAKKKKKKHQQQCRKKNDETASKVAVTDTCRRDGDDCSSSSDNDDYVREQELLDRMAEKNKSDKVETKTTVLKAENKEISSSPNSKEGNINELKDNDNDNNNNSMGNGITSPIPLFDSDNNEAISPLLTTTLNDGSVVTSTSKPTIYASNDAIVAESATAAERNSGVTKRKNYNEVLKSSMTATDNKATTTNKNRQKTIDTLPTTTSFPAMNAQAEAVMDSLCLDASMLLYSPHGMAMNLSPCQLDAVENILQNQLKAVEEGKRIQGRLLQKKGE